VSIRWKHVHCTVNAAPSGVSSFPAETRKPTPGVNPVWLQAQDALSESERRVRLMLDSAAEAICACDSSGTCLFSNLSAAGVLGYGDPAELLGRNLHKTGVRAWHSFHQKERANDSSPGDWIRGYQRICAGYVRLGRQDIES